MLSKISEGLYLEQYNFKFHHNYLEMCFYMTKKTKKGDTMTKFWYTLKHLHPLTKIETHSFNLPN